jgi:hypothetical protein
MMRLFAPLLALSLLLHSHAAVAVTAGLDATTSNELAQLEQIYFGHTFDADGDDLEKRTERVEKLMYGEAEPGDPKDRIKKMFSAIPQPDEGPAAPAAPPAEQPGDAYNSSQQSSASDDAEPQSNESYPRVSSLEKLILGQTYISDALPARLERLELKAFGSSSKNMDLSDRTDALQDYADKNLHKKPLGLKPNATAANADSDDPGPPSGSRNSSSSEGPPVAASSRNKQIMSMVGSGILGVASSALGVPGVFPAMAGLGMGAMQSAGGTPEPPPQASHPVDPLVSAPTPPPPNARLLTKVGWCEMQAFGRTYPTLHLGERLRQLSLELGLDTKKSAIELMDDVGVFIAAIQTRGKSSGNGVPQ